MIKIGFAKKDLEAALRPAHPVREERMEAISFCVISDALKCVWVTLDFMDFNLQVVNRLKDAVHDMTHIGREHIHILTTHNHGGGKPDLQLLASLTAECAKCAVENAVSAQMRYIHRKVDRQLNYIRRVWVPELDGVTTLYFGASEENGYNSAPFVEQAISDVIQGKELKYCGSRETSRDYQAFPPGDEEIFAVQFCNEKEETIGTIVRFAAHAVCCNRQGSFSSDYPYHVRKGMEEAFGGVSVFFNGPCGDIAPGMKDKLDNSQVRLGSLLAQLAIEELNKETFKPITTFKDLTQEIELPVRQELIKRQVVVPNTIPSELPKRRQYLEQVFLKKMYDFLLEKYCCGEKTPGNTITISLGALELNDLVFAAFPGETFSVTGKALKDALANKTICTVTEHGRTVMYLPPLEDGKRGGYEATCRVTELGAEKILRNGMIDVIKDFV